MGDLAGLQLQGLLQLFSLGTWILDMMTNDDKWWQMMIDVDWSIGQPNSTWRFKQQTWISLYYDLSNIHTQISPRTGLATFHGIFHVGGRLSTIKQHLKRQSNQSSQGQVKLTRSSPIWKLTLQEGSRTEPRTGNRTARTGNRPETGSWETEPNRTANV